MNETELLKLSTPVLLILALNVVGRGIKSSPLKDKWIPVVLPLIGGLTYPFIATANGLGVGGNHIVAQDVLYGIMAGGGAVWGNQLWRQQVVGKDDTILGNVDEDTETKLDESKSNDDKH